MAVFNSLVTRADAQALIPEQNATEVIKLVTQQSVALQLMRRVRMSSKTFRQPVLSALANAYWVNGDTGLKQTTDVAWQDVELVAEEIAAIVPVPDSVIADSGFPIWAEVQEAVAEAVGIALDKAVFSGTDKPATWPEAIIPGATAAGNTTLVDATAAQGGIATDLADAFELVEDDGYDVSNVAASRSLRALLRRARDSSGQKLLDVNTTAIMEAPVAYCANGVLPPGVPATSPATLAVVGQYDLAIIGVRQDLTFKLLDQAVITSDTGTIILNLAQSDTTAMRVVARFAYALGKPASRPEGAPATPYPFALLNQTV